MTSNNWMCRVCYDYVKQVVNKNIHGMLQTLLINFDILSSENPVICTACQEKLENCYYFKKKCMFTEDTLGPFVNENVKINLNEIPIQINKSEDAEKDKNVCRLCLQYSDEDRILSKDEKEQFQEFFPEINLDLTNFVVLCSTCYDMLQKYFLFVPLFPRSEEPLHKFPEDCDSKPSYGNSLEGCQEFTSSAEQAEGKKIVLLNEELHIKSEEGELCSSSMDCSIEQINGMKLEETGSTSMNTEDEDDKKLMLFHEELDIKSEGDSFENENFYSILGKDKSNFKIQSNKIQTENRRLSIQDFEEPTFNTTNTTLTAHTGSSKTIMHNCDECDYKSKRKAHLKIHILCRHTDSSKSKKYECDECDYKCKLQTDLKQHVFAKHSDPSTIEMYKCDDCEYSTNRKGNLKTHILCRHTDSSRSKKYKCDKCDYKCKINSTLKTHILLLHSDPSKIQMYQCEECDYKAKYKVNLKTHMLCRHTDSSKSKRYKCDQCDYECNLHVSLRMHMLKHSDPSKIEMYKCEECDYKTNRKGNLKTHILCRHTDSSRSKKYKCDKCDYKCKN